MPQSSNKPARDHASRDSRNRDDRNRDDSNRESSNRENSNSSRRRRGSWLGPLLAIATLAATVAFVVWQRRLDDGSPRDAGADGSHPVRPLLALPAESAATPTDGSPPSASPGSGKADALRANAMVSVRAGEFVRGRAGADANARPPRRIRLDAFAIDCCEVTNARFREFAEATRYVTTAERRGWGRVFDRGAGKTVVRSGADWRHPFGPESTIVGREQMPVVQVSWLDAAAFAAWDGKRLPTEAEFERAARGGRGDRDYPWGDRLRIDGRHRANTWQGRFPRGPKADDGFLRLAPVGSFPANNLGLHDLVGNVREWCGDWYQSDAYQVSDVRNPQGPDSGRRRCVRGGSWLSPEAGREATVWFRTHLPPDWSDDRTGFRCVRTAD